MSKRWLSPAAGAMIIGLVALISPLRRELTTSMTAQILVHVPLLVMAGWQLAAAFPRCLRSPVHRWNRGGITGLVMATVVAAYWMLPRSLDASTVDPRMAVAQGLSIPFLIGLPMALSWPRMGFVVRGVFLVEAVATLFRLGWLYRISPIRLCNNYALSDQQRLGGYLLAIGVGLLIWLAGKLLWGRFATIRIPQSPLPQR